MCGDSGSCVFALSFAPERSSTLCVLSFLFFRCQSEDIFDDPMEVIPETQEEDQASSNPILAAKRKRMALAKPAGGNREDGDERKANPFKKSGKVATRFVLLIFEILSSVAKSFVLLFSGAIRSGIVFDDMNPQAPKAKTGGDVKEGFGARRIKIKATMDKSGGPKQSPASTGRQTTLFEKSTTSKGNSGKENVGNDTNGNFSSLLVVVASTLQLLLTVVLQESLRHSSRDSSCGWPKIATQS